MLACKASVFKFLLFESIFLKRCFHDGLVWTVSCAFKFLRRSDDFALDLYMFFHLSIACSFPKLG